MICTMGTGDKCVAKVRWRRGKKKRNDRSRRLMVAGMVGLLSAAGGSVVRAASTIYFSMQGSFSVSSGASEDFFIITPAADTAAYPLTLQTFSSSGGVNAAGETVASGGIDSILKLYNSSNGLVATNDDAHAGTLDSLLTSAGSGVTLIPSPQPAGVYRVDLTNYGSSIGNGNWSTDIVNTTSSSQTTILTAASGVSSTLNSLNYGGTIAVAELSIGSSSTLTVASKLQLNSDAAMFVGSSSAGTLNANGSINLLGGSAFNVESTGTLNWAPSQTMNISGGSYLQFYKSWVTPAGAQINVSGTGVGPSALEVTTQASSPYTLVVGSGAATSNISVTAGGGLYTDQLAIGALAAGAQGNGAVVIDGITSSLNVDEYDNGAPSLIGSNGSTGSLTLQNNSTGTFWNQTLQIGVGGVGTNGTVNVLSGGSLSTEGINVATASTGSGTINISGSGSSIYMDSISNDTLTIGANTGSGTASVVINNGGYLFTGLGATTVNKTGSITLGDSSSPNASTLALNGNLLINGGQILIKNTGVLLPKINSLALTVQASGSLNFAGTATSNNFTFGPGFSTVTVTGSGSQLTTGASFNFDGTTANISAGAKVSAGYSLNVGYTLPGTLMVDGIGTTFSSGTGYSYWGNLGNAATVTVSDSAAVTYPYALSIGNDAASTVNITSGGTVNAENLTVGSNSGTPDITVTGDGSALTVPGGSITLGTAGATPATAVITLTANGTLTEGTTGAVNTMIGVAIGSGTFNLYDSGELSLYGGNAALGNIVANGTNGTINYENGTLGFLGNLTIDGSKSALLGANLYLYSNDAIALSGTTTIDYGSGAFGAIYLNGGAFSTGALNLSGGTISLYTGTLAITSQNVSLPMTGLNDANPLSTGKSLIFGQTVTIASTYQQNVNGGSFTAATLVNNGQLLVNTSSNFSCGTLTNNNAGRIFIGQDQQIFINSASTNAGRITLEGGALQILGTGSLTNSGVITGQGEIAIPVTSTTSGQIYPTPSGTLLLSAANPANGGVLNLNGGEVDLSQPYTNGVAGTITGRGTLRAFGGLTNNGQLQFSGGFTDVYGNVNTASGSQIIIAGGSVSTFYSPFTAQNGSNVQVATASTAVFFANVDGSSFFSGPGTKDFEAGASAMAVIGTPGATIVQSPASLTVDAFNEGALTVSGLVRITYKPDGGADPNHLSQLGALTITAGGELDMTNNDLVVHNGSIAAITAYAAQGYAGGTWTGTGLTSSTAAGDTTHLTALGVIQNSVNGSPNGAVLHSTFDRDSSAVNTDVLVKYTYYGDTNLDGRIDGSDYSRIDAAYAYNMTHPNYYSGWYNGDFNYDGVIDGSDYTLIDNAFNQQGAQFDASIAAQIGGPAAVPEPASIGLLMCLGLGLLGRKRAGGHALGNAQIPRHHVPIKTQ